MSAMSRWLARPSRPLATGGARLFCLPHAGAGASAYRHWLTTTVGEVDILPLQLPGRESRFREPMEATIEGLASSALSAIAPLLDEPYALFGHSMGAFVVFEMARLVARSGNLRLPERLFVSAARAPQFANNEPPIAALPTPEFLEAVMRWDGIDPAVRSNPELLDILLPILRTDLAVCELYNPSCGAPLTMPLTVFGGRADRKVSEHELSGWAATSSGTTELILFDAAHFYLMEKSGPILSTIARRLGDVGKAGVA